MVYCPWVCRLNALFKREHFHFIRIETIFRCICIGVAGTTEYEFCSKTMAQWWCEKYYSLFVYVFNFSQFLFILNNSSEEKIIFFLSYFKYSFALFFSAVLQSMHLISVGLISAYSIQYLLWMCRHVYEFKDFLFHFFLSVLYIPIPVCTYMFSHSLFISFSLFVFDSYCVFAFLFGYSKCSLLMLSPSTLFFALRLMAAAY